MEEKAAAERGSVSPHLRAIAIALTGGSKCKYIVRWAMEKFLPEGNVSFKLMHVFPKISGVPTPMGNLIPLPQVRDDVAAAYKKEVEWQKTEMIIQYQKLFNQRKVPAEVVLIESDDLVNAISMEIDKHRIKDLVIGVSSNSLFARKIKGRLLSSVISEFAPSFCTIYVVSKGKLESLRPSNSETNGKEVEYDSSASDSTNSSSRYTNSTFDTGSTASESAHAFPVMQTKHCDHIFNEEKSYINLELDSTELPRCRSINTRDLVNDWRCGTPGSFLSRSRSVNTTITDTECWIPYQAFPSKFSSFPLEATAKRSHLASSSEQVNIELELEKLRIDVRHLYGVYAMIQNERRGASATQRRSELNMLWLEEAMKQREIKPKEEKDKWSRSESRKFEAAKGVSFESEEKQKLKNGLAGRLTDIMERDAARWYRDRPDHRGEVLTALERPKDVADEAFYMASGTQMEPPNHFFCPILQKVMEDPYVASDGYTYERIAIEKWLIDNDTSPLTGFPLSNKNLIPNKNLRYGICDWNFKRTWQNHAHASSSHLS